MDESDAKILEILKEDSRTKYVEIAKAIGLTEGAVRRRVKKMLEHGVIEKFTIETKSEVAGVILIKIDPTRTKEVATDIKKVSDKVFEVSGNYDIAALISARTMEQLNRKVDQIRDLPAVMNTNTLIKLATD